MVNSSLAAMQRPGPWADNYKMVYLRLTSNKFIIIRGIEWSHGILKCSQNLAFARIARKN